MIAISTIMKKLWRGWKNIIHRINDVIAFVLMSFTYLIAVTPVALCFKVVNRDLIDRGLGDPQTESYWKKVEREDLANDIRRVQRQY